MWHQIKPAAIHLHKNLYRLVKVDGPTNFKYLKYSKYFKY